MIGWVGDLRAEINDREVCAHSKGTLRNTIILVLTLSVYVNDDGGGRGDFRRLNPCGVVGVLVTLTQDTHDGNFLAKTQYRLIFKDRRQRS